MIALYIVLGVVFLLVAACVPHNLRVLRVRKAFRAMPEEEHRRILRLIDDFAANDALDAILIDTRWRRVRQDSHVLQGYVGGIPYLETQDAHLMADPGVRFMLQVRLPALPEFPWSGDLLAVFSKDKETVIVRYANPDVHRCAPLDAFRHLATIELLEAVRLPRVTRGKKVMRTTWSPRLLLKVVPGVREAVTRYSADETGLMAQILRPNLYGYDLEAWDVIQVGGKPNYIQPPERLRCSSCGTPMRLIFQFGSSATNKAKSDGSVLYVLGCGSHLEQIRGYRQFD